MSKAVSLTYKSILSRSTVANKATLVMVLTVESLEGLLNAVICAPDTTIPLKSVL
jgi:hypothetical protein